MRLFLMLTSGTRLAQYEILHPLGAGGIGEVYKARDTRLQRDVAIKVLPPGSADDPGRIHRLEQEARSASGLHHPNILTIHDAGREGDTVSAADSRWRLAGVLDIARARTLAK